MCLAPAKVEVRLIGSVLSVWGDGRVARMQTAKINVPAAVAA
jgi:hypothetical protein